MAWDKMNLSTQTRGDKIRCTNCGYSRWWKPLKRPDRCPECKCPDDKKSIGKAVFDKRYKGKMLGCWSGNAGTCAQCHKPMQETPREGHPNSPYWSLERDDGLKLYNCNLCPEN